MLDNKEVQNQGATYQEEEDNVDIMESSMPKIPKKLMYVVGGVFALILIFIALRSMTGGKDPVGSPPSTLPYPTPNIYATSYTPEEVQALRNAGFTGPEIEEYETQMADVDVILEEQKRRHEDYLQSIYVELADNIGDPNSPEFKKLLESTWLGGKVLQINSNDSYNYITEQCKEIADYVKVPPRGTQLFIRITLDNGEYAFMQVHPSRWVEMKEEGNIVITYNLITFGGEYFIMDIMEVKV